MSKASAHRTFQLPGAWHFNNGPPWSWRQGRPNGQTQHSGLSVLRSPAKHIVIRESNSEPPRFCFCDSWVKYSATQPPNQLKAHKPEEPDGSLGVRNWQLQNGGFTVSFPSWVAVGRGTAIYILAVKWIWISTTKPQFTQQKMGKHVSQRPPSLHPAEKRATPGQRSSASCLRIWRVGAPAPHQVRHGPDPAAPSASPRPAAVERRRLSCFL